jgi:hypothetical protein
MRMTAVMMMVMFPLPAIVSLAFAFVAVFSVRIFSVPVIMAMIYTTACFL